MLNHRTGQQKQYFVVSSHQKWNCLWNIYQIISICRRTLGLKPGCPSHSDFFSNNDITVMTFCDYCLLRVSGLKVLHLNALTAVCVRVCESNPLLWTDVCASFLNQDDFPFLSFRRRSAWPQSTLEIQWDMGASQSSIWRWQQRVEWVLFQMLPDFCQWSRLRSMFMSLNFVGVFLFWFSGWLCFAVLGSVLWERLWHSAELENSCQILQTCCSSRQQASKELTHTHKKRVQ